jgi:hypothetical protein
MSNESNSKYTYSHLEVLRLKELEIPKPSTFLEYVMDKEYYTREAARAKEMSQEASRVFQTGRKLVFKNLDSDIYDAVQDKIGTVSNHNKFFKYRRMKKPIAYGRSQSESNLKSPQSPTTASNRSHTSMASIQSKNQKRKPVMTVSVTTKRPGSANVGERNSPSRVARYALLQRCDTVTHTMSSDVPKSTVKRPSSAPATRKPK